MRSKINMYYIFVGIFGIFKTDGIRQEEEQK